MKIFVLALASILHLVPHPFGISTIGALAIYGGAKTSWKIAWLVPLVPVLIGNLLFGFYDLTVLAFVYAGFALSALTARFILHNGQSGPRYGLAIATGAFLFFLISNYAVWLVGMYPPTIAGLVTCYINGLPYLGIAMLADGLYSLLLLGFHGLLDRQRLTPAVV
jgi:hypothetical protein